MIDIIIVACYFLAIILIGLYHKTKASNLTEFSTVGPNYATSKIILVATIFATSVGGGTTFGLIEKIYNNQIGYSYALIFAVIGDLAIAKFIVPKLVKYKSAISAGEIFENFYGPQARFITGLSASIATIGYLTAQISVSSYILSYFFVITKTQALILSYFIIIIYTAIGGLKSVIATDILQFFAMIIGIPIILIFAIKHINANHFLSFNDMLPTYYINKGNNFADSINIFGAFIVMGIYPTFIQRILINQNFKITQQAIYYKILIYIFYIVIISLIGISAKYIINYETNHSALLILIDQLIPQGIKGLVIIGLLSAVMSTADSDLNLASITIVNDLLKPNFPKIPEKNLHNYAKLFTIFIGLIGIIYASYFEHIVDLVIFAAGCWAPVTLIPLILGLYRVQLSPPAYIFSCICGFSGFIISNYFITTSLKPIFIGVACNLISCLIALKCKKA